MVFVGSRKKSAAARNPFAHRNRISRANFPPLPQPELPRVVRLLHRERVRSSPRARVQRHSQRGRAHRHLAALQVSDHRQRCHAPREPRHHSRHQQGQSGPGHLLLLVRRRGQGHRRRHDLSPRRKCLSLDRRRSQPPLVPPERPEHGCAGRRYFRKSRSARSARPDFRKTA